MNPDLLASPSSDSSRFHEILKNLTESDEGKLHILKVVYDVWRNHPQVQTHRTTSNRRGSDLKHFSHSVMETMLMFLGVFLCKNVHLECGVWRNVSLLHDRWSQCWWTKWFGRRLLTVPLLLTGSSLKIWLMSSPGEMWEINSTSVLFLIRGYKKIVQRICIYPVNSVFSFWLPPQNTLLSSSRLFIWEILHSTIRKMDKHVQKIQQELEEAKDKLEKQQHKRVTSSNT